MDSTQIRHTRRRLLGLAAALAGGGLLATGIARAHAEHQHGASSSSAWGGYTTSMRAYAVPDLTLLDRDAQPVRLANFGRE